MNGSGLEKREANTVEEVEAEVKLFNELNNGPGGKHAYILGAGGDALINAMTAAEADESDLRFAARCTILVQDEAILKVCNVMLNLATGNDIMVAAEAGLKIMQCIEGAANSIKALCEQYNVDFELYNLDLERTAINRETAEETVVVLRARREMASGARA